MAVAQWPFVAAVLLLVSPGLLSSSPLPACPEPCTCQRAPLLNCSSSGLSLVPQHIQDSVTELDLSHNLLVSVTLDRQHHYLRNVWLGNNSITRLSLCLTRDSAGRRVRGRQLHGLKPWSRQGCVSWAPTLQLLSAERNLLEELPEGLEAIESLQVLQLSFNRISTLQPGDLSPLWQLKELHLQHNLITSLHPQMFQDLAQLRVLDLSFNKLTSLHPLTYLSLRNIGADVRLDGNRWQCDCSMRSLRRRMAYDSSRGLQSWSVVCASPSIISGRDLLQLEEDDLTCSGSENRPELHQDVTVYSGSEILLSCSAQDSVWWTPSGQASASQTQDDLLITDITERDTGLYVCVSEEHEVGSVFNLQISKIEGKRREPRSLPQGAPNRIGQERNQRATQCNLTLAVCLSVFITFLIAFIIGVLVRPYIDILWRRVTKKKRSTETNSVPDVEQRQYDNEAYSSGEEPEVPSSHRERRVTFSDVEIRENTNVQYYDTVASGNQESLYDDAVFECEAAKTERDRHTADDSGSESSIRHSSPEVNQRDLSNAGRKHNVEFEHIPDPVELGKRRSSSSSSDSSLSGKEDRITRRDLTRPGSPQLSKGSVQQRADFLPARKELPQISEDSENLEFSSEPFADWSPHAKNPNLTDSDLWQENGEQFEFSDSVRSNSPRSSSVHGSFNDSKLIVAPTPIRQKRDETSSSSSSSYVSEGEPTEYTVNLDPVNEKDIESNHNKPGVTITPSLGFNQADFKYDPQRPTGRPRGSFSSYSSDSDGKDHTFKKEKDTREGVTQKKVVPMPRTKFRDLSLGVINHGKKNRAPPPPVAPSSSSSSESEAEIKGLKVEQNTGRVNEGIKISEPKIQSTKLDPQIKRSLDIKARVPASDSSSSSDSEAETTGHRKKQEPGQTNMARPPIKVSQTTSHDPQTQWPVLDLEQTTGFKRRLDIKVPSPASESSSSSDSEDEKTGHIKKHEQGQTNVAKLPIKVSQTNVRASRPDSESSSSSDSEAETTGQKQKQMVVKVDSRGHPYEVSQTVNPDLQTKWPVLDLGNTTHIKRRLDIKAPSPNSKSSSSSSDSENEKTGHTKKQEQGQTNMSKPPIKASQRSIRAPRPDSESSSSSDSEAETRGQIKKQEQGQTITARLPMKVSQTAGTDPKTQWPVLDLEHTTGVKRRLDIKAPSPASKSSSSSDSEAETTGHTKRQEQGQTNTAKLPIKASQHGIKEPKPDSDSSSSSDSEAEKTGHIKKQEQGQINMAGLPIKVSQTASYDQKTQWPVLDLEHTTGIKRRLDIKVPSRASESSSSSDSEDEKTGHIKKQEQGQTSVAKLPIKVSQTNVKAPRPDSDSSSSSDSEAETTGQKQKQMPGRVDRGDPSFQVSQPVNLDLQTRWPVLDLEHTTHIKRRLDIKSRLPDFKSSSSSSDSEKTGHIKKREQGQSNMVKPPIKVPQQSIKAPRPDSESSSSSDSEAETTGQINKQEQGQTNTARLPIKVSQTAGTDPKTQWPVLDLEHTTGVKRRLDIKPPSPDSESSSSSDSGDEQNGHIKKHEQGQANITKLPIKVSQTNVKAPIPHSDSSSSSDSEAETTGQKKKQMLGKVDNGGHPIQSFSPDLQTRWPVLDLGHTTRIKRRLDFKALSPTLITGHLKRQEQGQTNMGRPPITAWQPKIKAQKPGSESSSSSDSDTESTGHIKKQEQGQTNMAGLPIKISPSASSVRQTQWPLLDLEHTTRIKRRLDIKAQSPASNSSSSSDSEAEKTGHMKIQERKQTNMAGLPIKISQTYVKAQTPDSESSSSSDSEAEKTGYTKKQEQGQTNMARLPIKVSQTNVKAPRPDLESSSSSDLTLGVVNHGKKNRAPPPPVAPSSSSSSESEAEIKDLKLKQNTGRVNEGIKISEPKTQSTKLNPQIKRSLDIKARVPASDSSSSSDSETEKTGQIKKQEQAQTNTTSLFTKVSHTASNDRQTQWPLLDLEHKTSIKRRLDIKAPSPESKSSSSSDSEAEKTGHMKFQEQKQTNMAGLPIKISQTNAKAKTPDSGSSSSSDSEAEKTGQIKKQEQAQTNTTSLFTKVSHTASNDRQTQWPLLDLEHKTSIKRRLDIKAPSPESKSSSSSDSEAEKTGHMKFQEQKQTNMAGLPIKISQTNVKAKTPDSGSSSSSDSEAEKTGHTKKQEQGQTNMARLPIKVSQTNVKAPRPDLETSSSSDSDAETGQIKKQEQRQTNTASTFTKVSHTARNEPQTRWPLLDLEHKTSIKRRLDIKAPSPASESSSSSDSEDETTHKEKQELLVIAGLPFTVSQTVSHAPDKQWPAVDLGNTTRVKRRLDIKAPSPTPQALVSSGRDGKREGAIKVSSSSSSSSSDEQESSDLPLQVERDRTTVGITNNPLQTKLPDLDKSIPMVKRRLDIKAPSSQPNPIQSRLSHGSQQSSSSTSDSEDENHTRQGLGASTISKASEKKFNWSPKIPVLHTSRSPQTDHDIKLSKYTAITDGVGDRTSDNINTAPVVTPELESRWASMNLGISRFRKRLEITPHEPPDLPSSPPPDSPTSRMRRKRWGGITHTQSSITLEKASPSLMGQDDNSMESKDRLRKTYSFPVTEEKSTPETMLTSSANPHLKKYLDIKVGEKAAPPLRQRSHSSSSSDSENASTEHAGKGGRGRSHLNDTIDHSSPALSLGVQHTNRNINIKAPSSESSSSSSSSSENEHEGTGYTAKQSRNPSDMLGVTDNNSLITYKRQIFSSPTPDHTNQRQMGAEIVSVAQEGPLLSVGIRDESLAPRRVPSMNFDDVVKKRIEQSRHTTDVDLPPEIRWTGIGRQPSDLSMSSTRRTLDIDLSTPSAQPELHLLDSFNYSSIKSDDGTLRYEYSSLSTKSIHHTSSRAIDEFDNLPDSLNKISRAVPEDRRQSKGLSALKAMSSERRKWDVQAEYLDKGASPLFDDPQLDNSFYNRRPEKDIKPPEKRVTDLLYDIPRYRRHDIGGIGQPHETPPPLPTTPPPDVAVELKWGSPQSSMKQGFAGTRSHLQLNRNRVEPDSSLNTSQSLADYFDPINTNISQV